MKAELHALPDHQVMRACLRGIDDRRLTRSQAAKVISDDPGWIPAAIEPTEMLIYFVNVGQEHLDRWQFVYSIDALAAANPELKSFAAPFDVLEDLDVDLPVAAP